MDRPSLSLSVINFLLLLLLLLLVPHHGGIVISSACQSQKTWCVAKPSASDEALEENIKYACENVDCGSIGKDGPCFNPNTLISHASVLMNLFYRTKGGHPFQCHFTGSGLITLTDPSYEGCTFV